MLCNPPYPCKCWYISQHNTIQNKMWINILLDLISKKMVIIFLSLNIKNQFVTKQPTPLTWQPHLLHHHNFHETCCITTTSMRTMQALTEFLIFGIANENINQNQLIVEQNKKLKCKNANSKSVANCGAYKIWILSISAI